MAVTVEHRLDRRARILGERIRQRVALMQAMAAPDGHPALSRQVTSDEALAFWQKHRYDQIGMAILGNWRPQKVAQLDAWLAVHADRQGMEPQLPAERPLPFHPEFQTLLDQAMTRERRTQGPEVSSSAAYSPQ